MGPDVVYAHAAERATATDPLRSAQVSDELSHENSTTVLVENDRIGHALGRGDRAQLSVALLDPDA